MNVDLRELGTTSCLRNDTQREDTIYSCVHVTMWALAVTQQTSDIKQDKETLRFVIINVTGARICSLFSGGGIFFIFVSV
jgi:hypothetical protein